MNKQLLALFFIAVGFTSSYMYADDTFNFTNNTGVTLFMSLQQIPSGYSFKHSAPGNILQGFDITYIDNNKVFHSINLGSAWGNKNTVGLSYTDPTTNQWVNAGSITKSGNSFILTLDANNNLKVS